MSTRYPDCLGPCSEYSTPKACLGELSITSRSPMCGRTPFITIPCFLYPVRGRSNGTLSSRSEESELPSPVKKIAIYEFNHKVGITIQWIGSLSVMDTLGLRTTRNVLIRGVSSFQRLFCTHFYIVERFHCNQSIALYTGLISRLL